MALTERSEQLFRATSACHAASVHDANHAAAVAAKAVAELFEDALARGAISEAALFERRYTPIPHTNPPKHSSSFDALTDRILPPVQEQMLADLPHLAYAGAVDNNGYFPTHNKKFSQPLTGDYEVDLVHNRTKRIFRDRTGTRCASSRAPFLLQTYKRDTGEVMHDLSVPIWVAGRHWGGVSHRLPLQHVGWPGITGPARNVTAARSNAAACRFPRRQYPCGEPVLHRMWGILPG